MVVVEVVVGGGGRMGRRGQEVDVVVVVVEEVVVVVVVLSLIFPSDVKPRKRKETGFLMRELDILLLCCVCLLGLAVHCPPHT